MEIIGWPIWQRTICAKTNGKGKKHSKASRPQCLWITCFLRAVWRSKNNKLPRGPTNSYKCQIGFSNVLCKQLFLLDRGSRHSKPYYLQSNMFKTNATTSLLLYFMIWRTEKAAKIMSAVLLWNYRNDQLFSGGSFTPNVVKCIVGQTIDKPQVEKRVAAHGDHSPSHSHWTLLQGRPKSWKPLRH